MAQNTVSMKIQKAEFKKTGRILEESGLMSVPVKAEYESLRYSSDNCTAVLYDSGKLVLQGKNILSVVYNLEKTLGLSDRELPDNSENAMGWSPRIGADEVGKGDYFGPLVTAACFVDSVMYEKLKDLGISDSKKFSDSQILDLFKEIHSICMYGVSVVSPKEYNDQYAQVKNASILLAQAHATTIDTFLNRIDEKGIFVDKIVVDQFSKSKERLLNELTPRTREFKIVQFHKGEQDISVAAASIIARAFFLREMESMSQIYEFEFPKGASNVIGPAKVFVDMHGEDALEEVAKVSFKTTQQVLQNSFTE